MGFLPVLKNCPKDPLWRDVSLTPSPRDLLHDPSSQNPLPSDPFLETSSPNPRSCDLLPLPCVTAVPSMPPLVEPFLCGTGCFVARCVLASRCGLARFLEKVPFSRLFKPGLHGNRLLAAVLQYSIRKITILIDSFGLRFTSCFPASQSILFYSTFRARSSKTT